jgi:ankyrin repeat protein
MLLCSGKTGAYWAVVSHSTEVLDVLCAQAHSRGLPLNVSLPDHTGNTPLDIAVASQQWRAVKILVQYGGLNVRRPCHLHIDSMHARCR